MGHFYGIEIHGIVTGLSIEAMLLLTVSGNITWLEPPPFQTISDASSISRTNKQVIQGSLNEELTCNFILPTNLRTKIVSMKFGGQPAVTFVPNVLLRVEPFFAKHFNAVWVPNKLTLIFFNVTYAEEGEYCCEVVTIGRSARSWIRKIQLLVLDRIQTTVSAITASEGQRQTTVSTFTATEDSTGYSIAASEVGVPWGIIGAVVGVADAIAIAIAMVCFLKRRKRSQKIHHVDLGGKDSEERDLSQVQGGYAQSGPPAASSPKGQPFCDE